MAAKASIATADATKKNARYLLASVIVAAIFATRFGGDSLLLVTRTILTENREEQRMHRG